MIRDVHTTTQDVFLEEAAKIMIDNDISVLPVIDEQKKVIGIITEKDMFQAVVDLLGYGVVGTRFVIRCIDQPGYFQGIVKLFADNFANVESLAVFRTKERGTEAVVKASGSIPVDKMRDILLKNGYVITEIVQTTIDGRRIKHPTK